MFPATKTARGLNRDGFRAEPMSIRAVEKLIERYVAALGLDPNVTVHSLRVTALTTARERGSDIIDLQDFAGHADPRTTLTSIRSRDRLSKDTAPHWWPHQGGLPEAAALVLRLRGGGRAIGGEATGDGGRTIATRRANQLNRT
jgi:integrase